MNPYQFLKELGQLPPPGGDGVKVDKTLTPPGDFRTAAGLVLTAGTTPAVVAAETNAIVVSAVASSNVLGSFTFSVPKDYDAVKDEIHLRIVAQMGGATDTPTLNASIYKKTPGSALSSALTTVASVALSATSAEVKVDLSGNGIQPGDVLFFNITSGAHTTDAVNIYGAGVSFRSAIVYADPSIRNS